MKSTLLLASILAFGACGGDDGGSAGGVPRSTLLKDLTQAQTDSLCHAAAAKDPKREVTCPDDTTTDTGVDDAECSPADPIGVSESCTATVGNLEDCFDALADLSDSEICDDSSFPQECSFFLSCGSGSDDGSGSSARRIQTMRLWSRAASAARN